MTGSLQPPGLDAAQTGAGRPTPDAVRVQLARILEHPLFKRSARLSAFLRYVVEQTLSGRGDGIKEPTLALELYGRDADFDAGLDPIVRVDARRLRDKLREYYAESPDEPVVITLPKGSYVPAFELAKTTRQQTTSPATITTRTTRRRLAIWLVAIVAAAVTVVLLYSTRSDDSSSAVLRPLASLPGLKGAPSLSPDGAMVVFFWSGPSDRPAPGLYIKSVDGEDVRRLVDADPTAEPAWSPLGSEIAFSRGGSKGGVFIVSQVGGPERKISDSGSGVTWTPDGATVLFHDTFLLDGTPGAFRQGLFAVSLKTLEKRQLTRPESPIGDMKAAVSPDGSTLAFIRSGIPGLSDVYVVSMSGGEPRRVTDWNSLIEGLAWTPDGKEIIFGVYEPVGPRLWRIAVAASPGHGMRLRESTGDAVFPSISTANARGLARLAYFTRRVETSLRLVDLTERDALGAFTTSKVFQRSSRWDYGGRFSPDGRLVAFISTRTGTAEIWLAAPDGSDLRRLTDIKGDPVFPFWSSDSRALSFLSAPGRAGNKRLYTVGIDGGDPKPLTGETEVVLPGSWSRDGRWIYFMSDRSGEMQIWRMSPSGADAVQVTRNGGFEAQESPDGAFVYYTNRPPGEPTGRENAVRLMRIPAGGGDETLVIPEIRTFHWTVADEGIYFYAPGPPRSIQRYRFDTGHTERVGNLPDQTARLDGDMWVSRDGRRLFMSQIERDDTDLTLIENFR